MLKQCRDDHAEHEMALAAGLAEVAAELRLIDAADLIAFIRTRQFGNLRSLVNASIEMYFKPGTVSFGQSGEARLGWSGEPSIMLDMEFHHRAVDIFFRLVLEARQAGVEIEYISFGTKSFADPREPLRRLSEALADARFRPGSMI
ncbi:MULTISPECIES: hypothetical protein [Rhodomicrobium]|uniref:hypothetical protein n=1 Tax=Rhodomicrobium TaxID=1068 RepID=UPI000B4B4186|nr:MULTISPECIES: hypothetical protein [Rhodomicrobium]